MLYMDRLYALIKNVDSFEVLIFVCIIVGVLGLCVTYFSI